VAGLLTWPDYRSKKWPHAVRIEHHKNKALVWHPLEETIDGEIVRFYAEAEDILTHLPKLGIPMIIRRIEKGERKGDAKLWSYPGMEKLVQTLRKKIDGVSELFTLDACRHRGMTELEEAELREGQGRALSGRKTAQAYRGYAKETMRPASGMRISWRRSSRKNKAAKNFQMAGGIHFQMRSKIRARINSFRQGIQRFESWLGMRDSNLEMSIRKIPFKLWGPIPLIPEHFGTRDYSRTSCERTDMRLAAGLPAGGRMRTVSARNFWISRKQLHVRVGLIAC
jgi:hypothetical protein